MLHNVQAGEQVGIYWGGKWHLRVVDRVTPTQIILGTIKFYKENGRQVGDHFGDRIMAYDQVMPLIEQQSRIGRIKELARLFNRGDWEMLPLETLEDIWSEVGEIITQKR